MRVRFANNFNLLERIAYYSVVLFFAIQFSLNETALTYDGPSHVYNAGIIKEKLFYSSSFYDIFQYNNTPNWSTHLILALLQLIVSAEVSERVLLFILIILFNFSFRKLVLSWFPQAHHIAWFSMLLTFNFMFYFGFYNFIFGLIIGFILLFRCNPFPKNDVFSFIYYSTLWFILSFSHAFVFLLISGIGLWELFFHSIQQRIRNAKSGIENPIVENEKRLYSKPINLILLKLSGAIIPFVLILVYILKPFPNKAYTYLSFDEVVALFTSISPLVVFNNDYEWQFAFTPFLVLLLIVSLHLLFNVKKYRQHVFVHKLHNSPVLFWLPIFIGCFVLAFMVPDSDGYVGLVSIRMVFLTFIFGIILLSSIRIPNVLRVILMSLLMIETLQIQSFRLAKLNEMGVFTKSLRESGKYIKSNSFTLLYSLENNWFLRHAGMIAFEDNHSISLDNYEAEHPLFPISWKHSILPDIRVGCVASGELSCFKWATNRSAIPYRVDYVLLFGKEDQIKEACEFEMWQLVKLDYSPVYSNQHVVVMALNDRKSTCE